MPKGDRAILKADPDDGTTPISNLLLEALALAHLSGMEKGALLLLWRKTYGWCKDGNRLKEQRISLKQWATGLDIDEPYASKIISNLVKHNIIKQTSLGQGKGYIYTTNTNIATWNGHCINQQVLYKTTTLIQNSNTSTDVEERVIQNDNTTLIHPYNTRVIQNDNPIMPTKEILNKVLNKGLNKIDDGDIGENEMIKGSDKEILDELRKLPTWKALDTDEDWVNEITVEFPLISVSIIRACRDWHLNAHPLAKKRNWKSALRNWLMREEKNNVGFKGNQQQRKSITGNESRGGIAALLEISEHYNGTDNKQTTP